MHLTITLRPVADTWEIPVQYNRLVQSAIYNGLTADVGGFFHDVGFVHGGRAFKMFTFSRLMGRSTFLRSTGMLRFNGPVSLVVASPVPQFCSSLATGLLKVGTVSLGRADLQVNRIQVSEPKVKGSCVDVKMLSPTVVYSTMTKYDGGKYTCYFQPGEGEFQDLSGRNLAKKYEILTQQSVPQDPPYEVIPKSNPKMSVLKYKGTVIKGYTCFLRLVGPQDLLQVALDAGLGAKNSQGFGCLVPDEPVPAKEIYV